MTTQSVVFAFSAASIIITIAIHTMYNNDNHYWFEICPGRCTTVDFDGFNDIFGYLAAIYGQKSSYSRCSIEHLQTINLP